MGSIMNLFSEFMIFRNYDAILKPYNSLMILTEALIFEFSLGKFLFNDFNPFIF